MTLTKRDFFKYAAVGIGGAAAGAAGLWTGRIIKQARVEQHSLSNITGDMTPISVDERLARIGKAQRLMARHDIGAIIIEPGSAMLYFSGIRWRRSERITALVIPRAGEIGVVTPHFEEPSVRESLTFGDDVRPWHEHESPFAQINGILKDRGITSGRVGVEKTVRHFVFDGLQKVNSAFDIVSATPVTLGCRMYKTAHELELLAKANEVTMEAYKHVYGQIEVGMNPSDIGDMMHAAQRSLGGGSTWALILLNESSAYPHGSDQPQLVKEGGVVLMDCGCNVNGYQSDVSRSFVYGDISRRQRQVWNLVKAGQELVMETAQIGTPAGAIDDAVRRLYEGEGFGPGYATPGLPHRTGHGIGMDGHESVNFVHGEETPLEPGMCFSNEPGLYIYGEFGIRLEDCLYMGEDGPHLFTALSPSIDKPFG
jgi:Xaa-Pro aminopeptidase